jgi:hypothetical protein
VAAHAHTEHRENLVQLPNRPCMLSEQLATGTRTIYVHFDRDMDKDHAEKVRLLATIPLGVALAACEENLLRRYREDDHTMVKELRRLARRLLDNRSAASVRRRPSSRGHAFLEANCPLSMIALMHTARRFVGCLLHYAVYLQEIRDNDYEHTSLEQFDGALFTSIVESAVSTSKANKSLLYDELRTAADDKCAKPDERKRRLRALGVLEPEGVVSLAMRERLDAPPLRCVPDLGLALKSPTFVHTMMSGAVDLEVLRIYAFLTHQGEPMDDQLAVRLGANVGAAIKRPQELRAPHALDRLHLSTITLVLLALGCLRTFKIRQVHAYPRRGKSLQYRHDFCAERFDGAARVRHPWPPYVELSGDEFVSLVLSSLPRLKRDYGLCRGVRSNHLKTEHARSAFASIVNSVLGCAIIAGGAVRSDYLWYKAALVPQWARQRERVVVKPELLVWFESLGDVWAPVFEYEANHGGRPLRPFAHPAHARRVQTGLAQFAPPGERTDAELRKLARVAVDDDDAASPFASDVDEAAAVEEDSADEPEEVELDGPDMRRRVVLDDDDDDDDEVEESARIRRRSFVRARRPAVVDDRVPLPPSSDESDMDDGDSSDDFDNDDAIRKERDEELEFDDDDEDDD